MEFIDLFNTTLCEFFECDTMPNKKFIEVRRLDLCYNQFFETKTESFTYLGYMKQLVAKKQTFTSNITKIYDTSITYNLANGCYFKIYHKGSDYIKADGDYKKHLRHNFDYIEKLSKKPEYLKIFKNKKNQKLLFKIFECKLQEKPLVIHPKKLEEINEFINDMVKMFPIDVDFLKAEMDKVLRYEITLRSDFFRLKYKDQLFRNKCNTHAKYKEEYKKVHSLYYASKEIKNIPLELKTTYDNYNKWYVRQVSMMLGTTPFQAK